MALIGRNKDGVAEYDAANRMVSYKFDGIFNMDSTVELTKLVLKFSEENSIQGILVNIQNLTGTFTKLNGYFVNEYFPPLIARGLKCHAMVVPNDVFTKFSADQLTQKMGAFTMKNFNDLEQANQWLLEHINA